MTDKPDLTKVWAENADPTDIKNPDLDEAGKFQKGWLSEIPPHTWFNYIQNNFSAALAHFNEYGVAQWDSTTVYPVGGWARSTVDGEVYVALVAQSGNEPSASPVEWVAVLPDLSPYAPLNSPSFTGTPTAPTPPASDDSTRLATTEFVQSEIPFVGATVTSSGSNSNGNYRIWSDGFKQQWGSKSGSSTLTFSFPIAMGNTAYHCDFLYNGGTAIYFGRTTSRATTSCKITNTNNAGTQTMYWSIQGY